MGSNLSSQDSQVLYSWKQISSYTGRGVRTLQRYEANLGFPVHRPLGKPRSSVLAFKHEIDRWMAQTPSSVLRAFDNEQLDGRETSLRHTRHGLETLYAAAEKWRANTYSMQQGVASMQEAVNSMQEAVNSMQEAVNSMQEGINSMLQRLERTQSLVGKSKLHWQQSLIRRQRRQWNRQLHSRKASASAD